VFVGHQKWKGMYQNSWKVSRKLWKSKWQNWPSPQGPILRPNGARVGTHLGVSAFNILESGRVESPIMKCLLLYIILYYALGIEDRAWFRLQCPDWSASQECPPCIGYTHLCTTKGEGYHEPKHMKIVRH
jgi:hypothetical protein